MRLSATLAAAVLLAVSMFIACSVTFSDQYPYRCTTDSDCGGDGFLCATSPVSELRRCCKPTGPEVCDQLDNDCDGIRDNTGKTEICNGEDDDCDGDVDEGFDLQKDVNHCGRCDVACVASHYCNKGRCEPRSERICYDGLDDDGNGLFDCADPSCDLRQCGAACVCRNLQKAEDLCSDEHDNDDDNQVDCFDSDCLGKSCREGCTCADAGVQVEVDCADGEDNDRDGQRDCLDADCLDQFCTKPQIYYQCTSAHECRCNGGVQVLEVGSVFCRDGVDNDCDGETDCVEPSCVGVSCAPDGGPGLCECGGGKKVEVACDNTVDDDGDGQTDCDDTDCGVDAGCP